MRIIETEHQIIFESEDPVHKKNDSNNHKTKKHGYNNQKRRKNHLF